MREYVKIYILWNSLMCYTTYWKVLWGCFTMISLSLYTLGNLKYDTVMTARGIKVFPLCIDVWIAFGNDMCSDFYSAYIMYLYQFTHLN